MSLTAIVISLACVTMLALAVGRLAHAGGGRLHQWPPEVREAPRREAAHAEADTAASDIEVEEHESAVDAAQVLWDLGHVGAAIDILNEFIAAAPTQAVAPWLKLLEIHRRQGAREHYEQVAAALRRHFNVCALPWEAHTRPGDSLEVHPHVVREIVHRWGTHACHHYLGRLLDGNRNGERRGFGPDAVDEILLLTAILEEAHLCKPAVHANPGSPAAGLRRPLAVAD